MQVLIWAFGSMLVLILILFFLPLGFTIKGRLMLCVASFILALGGLTAATTFPLWQTALLLGLLIFFIAYFIQSKMGTFIYKENLSFADVYNNYEDAAPVNGRHLEDVLNDNLLDISVGDILVPSFENLEVKSKNEINPISEQTKGEHSEDHLTDIVDEDISFLLDRNDETIVEENTEDQASESNYLSEIEGMLVEGGSEEKIVESDNNWLDELVDLAPINIKETLSYLVNKKGEVLVDASSFDSDNAIKEVASGKPLDDKESEQ
jgi:hypothetical protein